MRQRLPGGGSGGPGSAADAPPPSRALNSLFLFLSLASYCFSAQKLSLHGHLPSQPILLSWRCTFFFLRCQRILLRLLSGRVSICRESPLRLFVCLCLPFLFSSSVFRRIHSSSPFFISPAVFAILCAYSGHLPYCSILTFSFPPISFFRRSCSRSRRAKLLSPSFSS